MGRQKARSKGAPLSPTAASVPGPALAPPRTSAAMLLAASQSAAMSSRVSALHAHLDSAAASTFSHAAFIALLVAVLVVAYFLFVEDTDFSFS